MKAGILEGGALVSAVALALLVASPGRSSAGCQDCEYDPSVDAYVCFFVGYGQEGKTTCQPTWASEDVWCKMTGALSICTQQGGPCCYHYPVSAIGKKRPWLTTQVLIFDLGGASIELRAFPVGTANGLDPAQVADDLRANSGETPRIVGASVQSSQRWTSTRFEPPNGPGAIFVARSNGSGFTLDMYARLQGQTARRLRQMRLGANEAAVLPIELDGRACMAVVYASLSENEGLDFESVRGSHHEPFTPAVEASKFKALMPLLVDSPRSSDVGIESWALRAMVDDALAVSHRRPR